MTPMTSSTNELNMPRSTAITPAPAPGPMYAWAASGIARKYKQRIGIILRIYFAFLIDLFNLKLFLSKRGRHFEREYFVLGHEISIKLDDNPTREFETTSKDFASLLPEANQPVPKLSQLTLIWCSGITLLPMLSKLQSKRILIIISPQE